ncbi:MAG: hypothetical protein A3F42_08270 [Gammaproteobacteria bacterium RIFCSPHIGHO2_12_FULL_37_34]|nr:MAG: hypothetical protein A3F42_08270 [Gammaproteobacteria bacterium RIFCSPHIGHO2_12_FULL_37_34]
MLAQRHQRARLQSDFYRDQYRKFLRWLMGAIFLIVILIMGIIYLVLFQPSRQYYASTTEGKILFMPRQQDLTK